MYGWRIPLSDAHSRPWARVVAAAAAAGKDNDAYYNVMMMMMMMMLMMMLKLKTFLYSTNDLGATLNVVESIFIRPTC